MALSDDQKAMLRLLAQRGESGYEDLAALKGLSVGEVHARVREALAQLEAEGIPAPAIPRPPGESASTPAYRGLTQTRPQEGAAGARRSFELPRGREARAALTAGLGVLVALIVVLLVAGGDDGSSTTTSSTGAGTPTPTEEARNAAGGGKEVTKAVLNPVDGSESAGVVIFGRVKNRLALQIAAEGLRPTASGESYTVWLAASPQRMLPLASTEVGQDGRIGAQVEVPTEILAYLANETFGQIAVTRTVDSQLRASLNTATSEKKAPDYTGTEVLRGTVTGPIVGAASR